MDSETNKQYPRVLVVVKTSFNDIDSVGASLSNWFYGWPRERLAQIHSGGPSQSNRVCSKFYGLGAGDRRLGKLFVALKRSALGSSIRLISPENVSPSWKQKSFKSLGRRFGKWLVASGLWELIFCPRLSKELFSWVESFRPQVIYAQPGGNLSFMRILLMLHREFDIPVCFQISDDWPANLYRDSLFAPMLRPVVSKTFQELLKESAVCLSNGEPMSREYKSRYGILFEPLMMCADIEKYRSAKPNRLTQEGVISIVYSGGLYLDRWKALLDLAKVAKELTENGLATRIFVFTPGVPAEAVPEFRKFPLLTIRGALRDEDVPGILKGADILFLPESFDARIARYIKYSISTKAHLYMMSERPALVYGPEEVAVVAYAKEEKWGYVVGRRDLQELRNAVHQLATNESVRDEIVKRGREVVYKNHEATVIREKFRQALLRALTSPPWPRC